MEEREDAELNLYRLVTRLLGRWWCILLAGVLGACVVLAGTFLLAEPKYQASVMFYVNNTIPEGEGVSSGDLTTSRNLVDSFIVLLTTRDALSEVMLYSGSSYSQEELSGMLSASAVNDTEFFRITVTGRDPVEAWKIAHSIGILLPGRIATVIQGTTATLVEDAEVPEKPTGPNYVENTAIGFAVGILAVLGWMVLRKYLQYLKHKYG